MSPDRRQPPRTTGIGRNSAIALSAAGWAVVLSGRRQNELEETAALCKGPGPALAVVGDVTKEADVERLFKEGGDKFGESGFGRGRSGLYGRGG